MKMTAKMTGINPADRQRGDIKIKGLFGGDIKKGLIHLAWVVVSVLLVFFTILGALS